MSRQNVLDRAIGYVSPERAADRAKARAQTAVMANADSLLGGTVSETRWRGASRTLRSMVSWIPRLGDAYRDNMPHERASMIARSYDAYRNHMIARAAIVRMRTNVIGTGLIPHAAVDAQALGLSEDQAEELNALIDADFESWAENPNECDLEGELDFYGLQSLALISSHLAGDCFAATPWRERPGGLWGLKVQLIDGERVCNPQDLPDRLTLVQGIEMDTDGYPLRIHVRRRPVGDLLDPASAMYWDSLQVWGAETGRRRVMHVWAEKDRIGLVRGTPLLAPILEPLQQLETYSRAELMAAVVSALFTVFIERESEGLDEFGNPLAAFEGGDEDDGTRGSSRPPDQGAGAGNISMGHGAIVDLAEGEKATQANPSRPNAQFDPFFQAVVAQMGAALEIPRDELMLVYHQSYSAARAAMLQAYRTYVTRRWSLVQSFGATIRQLWFDEAVARGRIPVSDYGDPLRRAAYCRAIWVGPARGSMDEEKEARGAAKRIETGISNQTIETAAMMGESWRTVNRQRQRELRQGGVAPPATNQTQQNQEATNADD